MLTENEVLTRGGITFDQMAELIVYKSNTIAFLKDIQTGYIIKRGLTEGNEAKLMGGIECIDDIIQKLEGLDETRKKYLAAVKEAEEARAGNQ